MKKLLVAFLAGMVIFGAAGCSKKVIKVEPVVEQPAPQPVVVAPAPVAPEPPAIDMDQIINAALSTVYFDYDKATLRQESTDRLTTIGKMLLEHTSVRLMCAGHADEHGTAEYNVALGDRRARAVHDWLVAYGIADNRLESTSYGKERPAVSNCADADDNCHAKNRRVEFSVLAK